MWVATILNIEKKMAKIGTMVDGTPAAIEVLKYEFTVKYYDTDDPVKNYARKRLVDADVTKAQVLNAIKNELADLNATDTFSSRVAPYLNTEIDETTVWT